MSSDKPKLKLVKQREPLKDPRNYWNTVGKNKEYYPSEPRPDSIPTLNKAGKVVKDPTDPWWINSKKDHYCFWTYVKNNSNPDGTMEPLLQAEIAELFGCSSTKVHFMLKEALTNLFAQEELEGLEDLLEEALKDDNDNSHNNQGLTGVILPDFDDSDL